MKVIELFAGIGSQTQALKNIGVEHEIVAISEIDKYAVMSYEAIHGWVNNLGDITKIKELPKADLWTYSFPCQDISKAGKMRGFQKGSGTRSGLLWEVERLLQTAERMNTLPEYLLLENVKDLASEKHIQNFNLWLKRLSEFGYENYWKVLNAADYGLPQNRERVFCVSILNGRGYQFPQKKKINCCASDCYEPADNSRLIKPDSKSNDLILEIAKDEAKIKQATKKGYAILKNFGVCALAHPSSESRRGRIIKGGKICPTITVVDPMLYKFIDGKFYKLSALEFWRLTGFTDEAYYKAAAVNGEAQLAKQAGNSIAVNCLEEIFRKMFLDTDLEDYQYNIFELNNIGVVNL